MYVNAEAELVTLAPGLRPERPFAPLARGQDKQNSIHHHLAPELINNFSQTEQIALSNHCGCNCRVMATELEAVKLELVIMQTNFENKLDSVIPEPTARSAVPGVSPGRGLLIPL